MATSNYRHWQLNRDENGLLWCTLDVAGSSANVLSAAVLDEFDAVLDEATGQPPAGMVIASGKDKGFIAGADIREFTTIENDAQARTLLERGHRVFNRLEALSFPTLCLIKGFCLGGGLELALACNYRIALEDESVRIGLPEVLLGIHPGFGGTMRLIRLLGPQRAMPLMLQGRTLSARDAGKLGLVDAVVPERQFLRAARLTLQRQPAPRRAGRTAALLNSYPARQLLAAWMRRELKGKVRPGHYPAPYALVDLWERHGGDEQAMLRAEIDSVARLANDPSSRNLVRTFLLQERLKSARTASEFRPKNLQVIGAGVMGGDIAAWCALQGLSVGLQDREPRFIAPAIKRAHDLYSKRLKNPRLVQRTMDRLIPDISASRIEQADVIIEAIIEQVEAKTTLYKFLEPRLGAETILATNTSSIALETLGKELTDPSRLVGIHFFNPVAKMQLVEVIHAEQTGQQWVDKATAFVAAIGRLPLPVRSSPGFLVNRILTPYLMEALLLHDEGIPAEFVDHVAVRFGMSMGPVELADTVGLDICLSVARNLQDKLRMEVPKRLEAMVAAGTLGRKTGSGFYAYRNGKPVRQEIDMARYPQQQTEDRLVLRILNECAACLREGIVADADLLDAGMIFGTGFPPFRGGPLYYARSRGIEEVTATLNVLAESQGERFLPDPGWANLG